MFKWLKKLFTKKMEEKSCVCKPCKCNDKKSTIKTKKNFKKPFKKSSKKSIKVKK